MTLTIELSPEDEQRLAAIAHARGVDPSDYAKKLLTDDLAATPRVAIEDDDESGQTVFEKFGHLFGTVQGLPPDLSTNPKYMEGFGVTKHPSPNYARCAHNAYSVSFGSPSCFVGLFGQTGCPHDSFCPQS